MAEYELREKIEQLEKRVELAEKCMANAWAFPSNDPTKKYVETCLNKYRKAYPDVYKAEEEK